METCFRGLTIVATDHGAQAASSQVVTRSVINVDDSKGDEFAQACTEPQADAATTLDACTSQQLPPVVSDVAAVSSCSLICSLVSADPIKPPQHARTTFDPSVSASPIKSSPENKNTDTTSYFSLVSASPIKPNSSQHHSMVSSWLQSTPTLLFPKLKTKRSLSENFKKKKHGTQSSRRIAQSSKQKQELLTSYFACDGPGQA